MACQLQEAVSSVIFVMNFLIDHPCMQPEKTIQGKVKHVIYDVLIRSLPLDDWFFFAKCWALFNLYRVLIQE